MNCFLIIRSASDIVRACDALSDFFSFQLRRHPKLIPATILGMWLDPHMVTGPPQSLTLNHESSTDSQVIPVRETVSTSGIWTLGWLGVRPGKDEASLDRTSLLKALLEASRNNQQNMFPGKFIPVFETNAAAPKVQTEVSSLRAEFPGLLLTAAYYDPSSGRLFPPGTVKN